MSNWKQTLDLSLKFVNSDREYILDYNSAFSFQSSFAFDQLTKSGKYKFFDIAWA